MYISNKELQLIADHQPRQRSECSLMRAAIAIILRDGAQGTEFLLMQRAQHKHDPWSGQMAFPGGKIDPQDESSKRAAIREAEEEVGIKLLEHDYIGQLDDLYGLKVDNQYSVHISCFVFKPQRELKPEGNYEVADLVWLPFCYLNDPRNACDYYHPADEKVKMPAVLINLKKEQILWGLSLRMLLTLHELLAWPMHVVSKEDNKIIKEIEDRNMDSSKLDSITAKLIERRN